ncbi:MAG: TIR domain-containing protein [Dehalococcoidia bacterium]|nr:TIR domain-containing protein [Dehalococcoidia bacterium]
MAKTFFLSHSNDDEPFVQEVANKLGKEECWFYRWDIKPGESIFTFDRGIADSRIFVLFWSAYAAKSPFVEDEVSQARIRISRDRGFRLVVVRLDTTPLPPALAYRSWIDGKARSNVVQALHNLRDDLTPEESYFGQFALRESFQDRESELDILERSAFSGNSALMVLGIDGIGKTSLMKRAVGAIFSHLTPVWVDLEMSSTPIRLISAIARPLSIQVDPHEAASHPEQVWKNLLLPEIEASARLFIVLDNLRFRAESDSSHIATTTATLVETLCKDLVQIHKPNNPGLVILAWSAPPFDPAIASRFKSVQLGPLDKKSTARVLRFYLANLSPLDYDFVKLEKLAESIGGYPAAINAVAHRVAQQGIEATLADQAGLHKIRHMIGEDLFSRITLQVEERQVLTLLATAVYPLSDRQLKSILRSDFAEVESIKHKQLLDPTSQGYALHSILRDYVSESMSVPNEILECHRKLADLFDREWRIALSYSAERAEFASLCHFHTIASGGRRRARLIEKDYLEEAKAAAVELYRRGQYGVALTYLEAAKRMGGTSDPVYDFYYGLCLNRLGRSKDALDVLSDLAVKFPRVSRYHHAVGTVLRYLGKNDEALAAFRKAVALATVRGKVTPLCSLADLLTEMGRASEAITLIEEALDLEPGKSFVVATASMVYDAIGQKDKALSIIRDGLRISPGDSRLHHRAGILLKGKGILVEAKEHLEQASRDPSLGFSVTALADVYLELGEDKKAEETVDRFPGNKQRSTSYLSTKANILRRKGDYDTAETLLKKALRLEPKNVIICGGLAQVQLDKAQSLINNNDKQSALISLEETKGSISRGLEIEPDNKTLLSLEHRVKQVLLLVST